MFTAALTVCILLLDYFVNVCSIVLVVVTSYSVWKALLTFILVTADRRRLNLDEEVNFSSLLTVYLHYAEVLLSKALNLQLFQLKRYCCGGAGQVLSGIILYV